MLSLKKALKRGGSRAVSNLNVVVKVALPPLSADISPGGGEGLYFSSFVRQFAYGAVLPIGPRSLIVSEAQKLFPRGGKCRVAAKGG